MLVATALATILLAGMPGSPATAAGRESLTVQSRRSEAGFSARAPHGNVAPLPGVAHLQGFVANAGQLPESVQFICRSRGFTLLLTNDGSVAIPDGAGASGAQDRFGLRFSGAHPESRLVAGGPAAWNANLLLGKDPRAWRRSVPVFETARLDDAYPGIDVVWEATREGPRYSFHVATGADPAAIKVAIDGATILRIAGNGDLILNGRQGFLRHSRPVAFQEVGGRRRPVAVRFEQRGPRLFGFRLGAYDFRLPVVIDPVLAYSSYFGDASTDRVNSIAVVSTGEVFVAGETSSASFPTKNPIQGTNGGGGDAFVAKFAADGKSLEFATFLGGSALDSAVGVGLDGDGNVYVAGRTSSTDFPTASPYQGSYGGSGDAFIAKLLPDGSDFAYSTYYGGTGTELPQGFAVHPDGTSVVCGRTAATDLPTSSPFQGSLSGTIDGFVAKFTADGSALSFATYLGGTGIDECTAVAVDANGAVYVTGNTNSSTSFPRQSAFQTTFGGGATDAFVTKFSSDGSTLAYSTFLGGSGTDGGTALLVDETGACLVVGSTSATNFPTQNPYRTGPETGVTDGFLTKFNPSGSALSFSTYLGGNAETICRGVAVDGAGSAYVTGETRATNFPTIGAVQGAHGGGVRDAFLTKFAPGGSSLVYSTFIGGAGDDIGRSVALRGNGAAYVAGETASTDFPLAGAFQESNGGGIDGLLAMIFTTPIPPGNLTGSAFSTSSVSLQWTDNSDNETAFEVERRTGAGAFALLATLAPDAVVHIDTTVSPDTTYGYRVRAVNADGPSDRYTNELEVTTPEAPPAAPTGLVATTVAATSLTIEWTDESNNETSFLVSRAIGGGAFETIASVGAGVVTYTDATVLPARNYAYSVRALGVGGFSASSSALVVSTPETISLVIEKGTLKDTTKVLCDRLVGKGTLSLLDGSPDQAMDPRIEGWTVRLDGPDGQVLAAAPGPDEGWRTKRTKATWKSPRGSAPKVKMQLDLETGAFKVVSTKLELAEPPTSTVTLWLAIGNDAGTSTDVWTEKKPGRLKFP